MKIKIIELVENNNYTSGKFVCDMFLAPIKFNGYISPIKSYLEYTPDSKLDITAVERFVENRANEVELYNKIHTKLGGKDVG